MAHELDVTTGRAAMAYVGTTPWHGLGERLVEGASFDQWLVAAGMNFEIATAPAYGMEEGGNLIQMPGRRIAYRSDTKRALSVISDRYKVVQPERVLRFFEDLVEAGGFTLETAGVLYEGRRYWALAKANESATLPGGDKIEGYLLLASSVDGELATQAQFTSIRVVCKNTMAIAVNRSERGSEIAIRVPHCTTFDPKMVKEQLGLVRPAFGAYAARVEALAKAKVTEEQAKAFVKTLFGDAKDPARVTRSEAAVFGLFNGGAIGADMESANGTAWGLVNAVTEYLDHVAGRSPNSRLNNAWFGEGARIKQAAFGAALDQFVEA